MRSVFGLVLLALLALPCSTAPAHAAATCTTTTACGLNGTADGLDVTLDGFAWNFAESTRG